jgi:hypothetical protein
MELLGQCRLCKAEAVALRDSHLMPAAVYRVLRNAHFRKPDPFLLTTQSGHRTSTQIKQLLLCADCEKDLDQGGENWVMARCWRGEGKFVIQEVLAHCEPLHDSDGIKIYAGANIPELNMDRLVYFGASVFWRAAAAHWRLPRETLHIELGPYLEPLRRYLRRELPFPDDMVLHIGVAARKTMLDVTLLPKSSRTKSGVHRHRFIIPGLTFTLLVGAGIDDGMRQLCAAQSANRHISIWLQSDEEVLRGSAEKMLKLGDRLRW